MSSTVLLVGCGAPVVVPDRPAFDRAVQAYLSTNSMDLAISEYREFELGSNGKEATAVIALVYAGEGYSNVKVRFRFRFKKPDTAWRVIDHKKL